MYRLDIGRIIGDRATRHTRRPHHAGRASLLAASRFGDLVKAVVDIRREVMLLDADLHADQEADLLADGSTHTDLWGINLYPAMSEHEWLEFDSMINLRPSSGNRSRGVDDASTRTRIQALVDRMVKR